MSAPVVATYRLPAVDAARFAVALTEAARAHEALRTYYRDVDGHPTRLVARRAPLVMAIGHDDGRPVPAGVPPLARVTLAGDGTLVVAMHPLIADEWAPDLLVADAVAAYRDPSAPRPARGRPAAVAGDPAGAVGSPVDLGEPAGGTGVGAVGRPVAPGVDATAVIAACARVFAPYVDGDLIAFGLVEPDATEPPTLGAAGRLRPVTVDRTGRVTRVRIGPVGPVRIVIDPGRRDLGTIDGAPVTRVPAGEAVAPGGLTVRWSGDRITVTHDRTVVADATAARIADRIAAALAGDTALPATEAAALDTWSRGPDPGRAAVLVTDLVAARAATDAEAVAVDGGGRTLTYGQLDAAANRLAGALRDRGIGPEDRVAVCLPRTVDLPVALLGVLRAGAAYVPLDPAHPPARLAYLLADSGAAHVVTTAAFAARLPGRPDRRLLLDRDAAALAARPARPPAVEIHPDGLAYVLYTSGSTGTPKGVAVSHGNLAHYVAWAIDAYPVAVGGSVPLHSSIAFDLTVTALYPTLSAGGRIRLLADGDDALDALVAAARAGRYDLVKLTPAHLRILGEQLTPDEAARVTRRLVVGGEALDGAALGRWGATAVVNEYGPTEATVGCCVYEVRADRAAGGPVPIGRPIAGSRLHLLGPDLAPVPVGAVGEIYIGGPGVARGYHGRPGLTAERFVPSPFETGQRLYRTGDLARHRPDGDLVYLGRVDDQVKVDGYRVEPAEVESALLRLPGVRAAAVRAADGRLVAHVVADRPTADLTDALRRTLPAHLLPASYVAHEALPLTPNGKVDRAALAAPAPPWAADLTLDAAIVPPGPAPAGPPRHVLLTGATGYLGAHLLAALLSATDAEVTCLVRAPDAEAAGRRLAEMSRRYRIDLPAGRVTALPGDLAAPGLGWDPAGDAALASGVDTVIHAGARVNFVASYTALRPDNVTGTREILRFCTRGRTKILHLVSTLDADDPPPGANGYRRGKWVSERLVAAAVGRGLPALVFAPGVVLGHSRTGAANPDDLLCRLLKGCVELGAAPAGGPPLRALPVDWVAATIVATALGRAPTGDRVPMRQAHPLAAAELWHAVAAYGYPIDTLPYPDWLARAASAGPGSALRAVAPLLAADRPDDPPAPGADRPDGPPIGPDHVHRILDHLVDTGFLPPPPRGGSR